MLIPTQHKSKVYQGWSYPVGGEIVSDALTDISQYDAMNLWFSMPPRNAAADSMGLAATRYLAPRLSALERNWKIDICAVPCQHRALARELLIEQVLPRFKLWFEARRPPIWYDTCQGLYAAFNWQTEGIEYR